MINSKSRRCQLTLVDTFGWFSTLILKRDCPVEVRNKFGPTIDPHRRHLEEGILRLGRDRPELHGRFARRSIGLASVTPHASQNNVGPRRLTTLRTGYDMVQSQFLAPRLAPTVLAGVVVPLEQHPPGKRLPRLRELVVVGQNDDLGDAELSPTGGERVCILVRTNLRPVAPGHGLVVLWVYNLGPLLQHLLERTIHRGGAQHRPGLVQHQNRSLHHCRGHHTIPRLDPAT